MTSAIILIAALAVLLIIGVIIAVVALCTRREPTSVTGDGSYFDGNTFQLIGYRLLSGFVTAITFGIAYPWMLCMVQRWEVKHTVIHGRRLKFNGHGHQLIGKYLLWVFLTVITFGIYGIWLGLGMKKWVVKHTVYADEKKPIDSYFSGGAGGYLGIHLLSFLLTLVTFGIGKAWADKMVIAWEAKHTHIGGSPLEFNGTGGQLFVKYLLFVLLTPLTLGIYAIFFVVSIMKWKAKHTEAVYQTPAIQAKARAHETSAVQDFAKYRIAANDQEIASMKSGYTGNEDAQTLERMSEEGNPFAAYHLAKVLKGEATMYEGRALELLRQAANGKVHSALFDLANQSNGTDKIPMLTEAAQCGNADACWALAVEYKRTNNLQKSAYWFKVALEWGVDEANGRSDVYDELVKNIALQLSEKRDITSQSKALPIILGVVGGLILLLALIGGAIAIFGLSVDRSPTMENAVTMVAENVYIMQSLPSDSVRGTRFNASDVEGQKYQYILDENMFYDREKGFLYFEFADINGESGLFFSIGDMWKTGIIRNGGIFRVKYDYPISSTERITMRADNGTIYGRNLRPHTVSIRLGTTAEAEVWLQERYDRLNQGGEVSATITESIVGQWKYMDSLTNIYTGEDELHIWNWTFKSDGTFEFSHQECMTSKDGTGEYINGAYWIVAGGSGMEGQYTVDENGNLTIKHYIEGESAQLATSVYTVVMENNKMTIDTQGLLRTYDRVG